MRIQVKILTALLCMALSSLLVACGGSSATADMQPTVTYVKGVVNMPAGFQVFGTHGAAQIDGQSVNLALTGRGQFVMPASGDIQVGAESVLQISPQITIAGVNPVLCIRSTAKAIAIGAVQRSGSTFYYTLIGRSTSSAATVDWYVFDTPSLLTPSRSGGQVFTPQGTLVFDAMQSPMRVVNVGSIPAGSPISSPGRLDAPYSGTFAACLSQGRIASVWQSPYTNVFMDGILIDANGLKTQAVSTYLLNGNTPIASPDAAAGILVDVSGL